MPSDGGSNVNDLAAFFYRLLPPRNRADEVGSSLVCDGPEVARDSRRIVEKLADCLPLENVVECVSGGLK